MSTDELSSQQRDQSVATNFTLRDYLEAARLASNRARTVTIVLLVTSVVMLIGMLNSLYHSWAQRRILASASPYARYVADNIGPPPVRQIGETEKVLNDKRSLYQERYHELYASLMKEYVESEFGVRVPLFGVKIDVNDLGAFGGFALLIVLFMFDYSARREAENLSVSFNRAMQAGQVHEFYDLLAMHQLFTVPLRARTEKRERSAIFPKAICLLPIVVQIIVVAHDLYTNQAGDTLDPIHNDILNGCAFVWLLLMIPISIWTLRRLQDIDHTWDSWAAIRFADESLQTRGSCDEL